MQKLQERINHEVDSNKRANRPWQSRSAGHVKANAGLCGGGLGLRISHVLRHAPAV